jgi:hypothetical protein
VVGMAYLRVFRPMETLRPADRARWERFILERGRGPVRPAVYRERRSASGGRLGLLTAEEDLADVRTREGRLYVCPWRTRLRVLASILSLRESFPAEVADALVPQTEARRAARELARLRRRDPRAVPAILQTAWHVPVRWFLLFEDGERRLVEGPDDGFSIRYWTGLPAARRRVGRAIRVLQRGGLAPVAEIAREMDEWLSSFDGRSAVELDYADVAASLSWNELDEDHSARDIQAALDALESGDIDRAGDLYQGVAGRWTEAKIRESLN